MTTKNDVCKHSLYLNAMHNSVNAYISGEHQDKHQLIKRSVFYGVKAEITKPIDKTIDKDEAISDFTFTSTLLGLIASLTPIEFMSMFPVSKTFDGEKWGTKDYFYTMDYIRSLDSEQPLGDKATEFLWEYTNRDIMEFNVVQMKCIDNMRMFNGEPSMAEKWCAENSIGLHRQYTDQRGQTFTLDPGSGKTTKLKKILPPYIKLLREAECCINRAKQSSL